MHIFFRFSLFNLFTLFSTYFIVSNLLYFIVSNIRQLVINFGDICDTLEWLLQEIFALKQFLQFAILPRHYYAYRGKDCEYNFV